MQPSVHHKYGTLGATAFTTIVAVAPALFVIACVALGLYLCQRRARNQQLLPKMIPFAELKVTSDSPVLYQGIVCANAWSMQDGIQTASHYNVLC